MTEAEILAKLNELDTAIALGVESFTFADQSTTFRSVADLLRARAHFESLLAAATSTSVGYRLAATSKGV